MMIGESEVGSLQFETKNAGPLVAHLVVTIPASIGDRLYQEAIIILQKGCYTHGFSRGQTPSEYIARNFAVQLKHYMHDFCLNYFALPFLYKALRIHKLLVTGQPRVIEASVAPGKPIVFTFHMAQLENLPLKEWKYLPFKPPRRKRYKDLDRQAEQFIKVEQEFEKNAILNTVNIGDWVHLAIAPAGHDGIPLFGDHMESFWLKIGADEIDKELNAPIVGKKIGERLCIENESLQNHFCNRVYIPMPFIIVIQDVVHDTFFCFEQFKKCFRLKSKKEIVQKLIEVFSYQHDMSQRRSMAERSLALILAKNKFDIPHAICADQEEAVLHEVKYNPDYHVYRTQKDFQKKIEQLAKKQAAESLLLDHIMYSENIEPQYGDIRSYFNFLKRPRTKEFLYFNPPMTRLGGQESLLYQEEIALFSCREKTLNHIIHHLTRA